MNKILSFLLHVTARLFIMSSYDLWDDSITIRPDLLFFLFSPANLFAALCVAVVVVCFVRFKTRREQTYGLHTFLFPKSHQRLKKNKILNH